MSKGVLYLERNGKFYGPFTEEKIRAFLESGKITMETKVAESKSGEPAQALKDHPILQAKETPNQPAAKQDTKAPSPTQEQSQQESTQPTKKEWFILTKEREFGPYGKAHLKALYEAGKLPLNAAVKQLNQAKPIRLKKVLDLKNEPMPSTMPSEASPSKGPAQAGVATQAPKKKFSNKLISGGLLLLICGAAFLIFFNRTSEDQSQDNFDATIKRGYGKTPAPSLRKEITKRKLPPFNLLVQNALKIGLNFPHGQVVEHHLRKGSLLIYESDGPKNFDYLYPDLIRREIRYIVDNGYNYTYLSGYDGMIFAVIVTGPNFYKFKLTDYRPDSFAEDVKVIRQKNRTFWQTEPADGLLTEAVWTKSGSERRLNFVLIRNKIE